MKITILDDDFLAEAYLDNIAMTVEKQVNVDDGQTVYYNVSFSDVTPCQADQRENENDPDEDHSLFLSVNALVRFNAKSRKHPDGIELKSEDMESRHDLDLDHKLPTAVSMLTAFFHGKTFRHYMKRTGHYHLVRIKYQNEQAKIKRHQHKASALKSQLDQAPDL